MVSRAHRFLLGTAVALLPFFSAVAKAPAEYQIGDRAEEDIVAPGQLVVVDREATEVMREREGQRVPVVMRFHARAADEAVAAFQAAFAETRSNFWSAAGRAFATPVSPEDLASLRFVRFVNSFQKQNLLFPVGTNLAGIWVRGENDQDIAGELAARLRDAMQRYVRADVIPKRAKVGGSVRLVPLADNETPTEQIVAERGFNVGKTNLVSLPRAKSELMDQFSPEEHLTAKYLATFVKPVCEVEEDITLEMRARRTAEMWAADRYDSGQVIARRGQVIDKKIKAALDQIEEKRAIGQLQKLEVTDQIKTVRSEERNRWLGLIIGGLFLVAAVVIWRLSRRPAATLLPARLEDGPFASDDEWRRRALLAEQGTEKARAAVRAGMIAQLSRWMSQNFVQRLVSQRENLLDAQQHAAADMAELEARLEQVHTPLKERLQTYESRIVELEKELAAKGEENRELLKAKIQLTRKQLELERGKNRIELN